MIFNTTTDPKIEELIAVWQAYNNIHVNEAKPEVRYDHEQYKRLTAIV